MMKLKELLKGVDYYTKDRLAGVTVDEIISDSRLVKPAGLFVAVRGEDNDGHNFIKDAIERGARVVVLEKDVDIDGCVKIKVKDSRKALALIARRFYDDPSKKIKVIGITGTNGKTTITYLLENILACAGFRPGVIGTIRYKAGSAQLEAENTTPSSLFLQGFIRKMVDSSLDYCVMEVSSHALEQHRTDCIDFDAAIFTNATREHLDYHRTFGNYLNAKMKLFKKMKRGGLCVINKDDPNFEKVRGSCASRRVVSYGLARDADVYAGNIASGVNGVTFTLGLKGKGVVIKSSLLGLHNIYNMLAAASCAAYMGIDDGAIRRGLEATDLVPGRLETVTPSGAVKVFVDYAHTDDALKNVLTALNSMKHKNIITVFGCGGNRDKKKRPRMGRVATRLSDLAVITSDNPRYEEPEDIAGDIMKGIDKNLKNFNIILDRREAIRFALSKAQKGDIVLIAGKGHERYQIIKDKKIPHSDTEVAKEALKDYV